MIKDKNGFMLDETLKAGDLIEEIRKYAMALDRVITSCRACGISVAKSPTAKEHFSNLVLFTDQLSKCIIPE